MRDQRPETVAGDASVWRRYLLGQLDASEEEGLEQKLMTSDEDFQELRIAEDELVDDYCAGHLDASEEQAYRERFLATAERRRQHRFGAALRRHVAASVGEEALASPSARAFWWKLSFAAAAIAGIIALGVWSARDDAHAPFRLEPTGVEGPAVAFYLTTGNVRGVSPVQTIDVLNGVAVVELQLDAPADTQGDYDVRLEDAATDAVVAEGVLPARTVEGQTVVVAPVPAELLTPGDYRVVLREASGAVLETFAFRVTRQ